MIKLLITLLMLLSNHNTETEEGASKVANPVHILSVKEDVVEEDFIKRPVIRDLPLPEELQEYIWNKSNEYGFSYELILAIAKVESNFNYDEKSSTSDYGMMQIHRPTARWIAEELELDKYDLSNPYTSVDFALYYLDTLRDAWDGQGLSEEDMFDAIIISYNRGVTGANRYIERHGVESNTYLNRVLEAKTELEMNIIE